MITYIDRHGKPHTPKPNDLVKDRSGVFAIIIHDKKLLVTAGHHAPNVPELPGGGIDPGEDTITALLREIYEETGQTVTNYSITCEYHQKVNYYADDLNEYWNYDRTYFQIDWTPSTIWDSKIDTPDGGKSWWMNLDDVSSVPFRASDKIVLQALSFIK